MELDIFPTEWIPNAEYWVPLSFPNMKVTQNPEPFIAYLPKHGYQIRYKRIPLDYYVRQNYLYTLDHCRKTQKDLNPILWQNVDKRLRRCYYVAGRKNRENLAFRWGNTFLTNSLFTFGSRTVRGDECHIIQTHNTRILFYLAMDSNRMSDKTLNLSAQFQHYLYVLQPHSVYVVKDMSYVLLTFDKTLFAIDCCSINLVRKLQRKYHIVLENPKKPQLRLLQSNWPITTVSKSKQKRRKRKRNFRNKHKLISPPRPVGKTMYPSSDEMEQAPTVKGYISLPPSMEELNLPPPPAEVYLPLTLPVNKLSPPEEGLKFDLAALDEFMLSPRSVSVGDFEGLNESCLCIEDYEMKRFCEKYNATVTLDTDMVLRSPLALPGAETIEREYDTKAYDLLDEWNFHATKDL